MDVCLDSLYLLSVFICPTYIITVSSVNAVLHLKYHITLFYRVCAYEWMCAWIHFTYYQFLYVPHT